MPGTQGRTDMLGAPTSWFQPATEESLWFNWGKYCGYCPQTSEPLAITDLTYTIPQHSYLLGKMASMDIWYSPSRDSLLYHHICWTQPAPQEAIQAGLRWRQVFNHWQKDKSASIQAGQVIKPICECEPISMGCHCGVFAAEKASASEKCLR